jgi:DNA polymerase III sliding clamp (beta) subunit (PCNA family)
MSDTTNLVPASIAALGKITDEDSTRYALGAIHLVISDGKFTAEATDTRVAMIVKGECPASPADPLKSFRKANTKRTTAHRNKSMTDAPKTDAMIRPADMRKAIALSTDGKKFFGVNQNCQSVKIAVDEKRTVETELVEGKFPKIGEVIPMTPPAHTIFIDPRRMRDLMDAVAAFVPKHTSVVLEFRDDESCLAIRSHEGAPVSVVALIMPMRKDQ